jgi:hypothetical protein
VTAFRADVGETLAAMCLFVRDGDRAYYHLAASTPAGYEARASYGLLDYAIRYFSDVAVVDLGGGAGRSEPREDGLAHFKAGFANGEADAWLVGAILDGDKYRALAGDRHDEFFPLYRAPLVQTAGTKADPTAASRNTNTDASHSP